MPLSGRHDPNQQKNNLLRTTARNGRRSKITQLLNEGADPDDPDARGWTALLFAVEGENRRVIAALIPVSDVTLPNNVGQTALHLAAQHGIDECITPLFRAGADINAQDVWGQTPLHYATRSTIAKKLVSLGADCSIKNENGLTVFDVAGPRVLEAIADQKPPNSDDERSGSISQELPIIRKNKRSATITDLNVERRRSSSRRQVSRSPSRALLQKRTMKNVHKRAQSANTNLPTEEELEDNVFPSKKKMPPSQPSLATVALRSAKARIKRGGGGGSSVDSVPSSPKRSRRSTKQEISREKLNASASPRRSLRSALKRGGVSSKKKIASSPPPAMPEEVERLTKIIKEKNSEIRELKEMVATLRAELERFRGENQEKEPTEW